MHPLSFPKRDGIEQFDEAHKLVHRERKNLMIHATSTKVLATVLAVLMVSVALITAIPPIEASAFSPMRRTWSEGNFFALRG